MSYTDEVQAAIDDIYDTFAVAATYTSKTASQFSVQAIIEFNLAQYGDTADISGMTAAISVRRSEIAAPPLRGETFFINGTLYTVDSPLSADEMEHTVLVA